jgi:hypothetical protein
MGELKIKTTRVVHLFVEGSIERCERCGFYPAPRVEAILYTESLRYYLSLPEGFLPCVQPS